MQIPAVITDSSIAKEAGYSLTDFLTSKDICTPEEISIGYTVSEGNNVLGHI